MTMAIDQADFESRSGASELIELARDFIGNGPGR
jgi:hypothetical protein